MIVVDCVDDVFLAVLHNLPHGPTHHVASCVGCDSQTVAFTWRRRDKQSPSVAKRGAEIAIQVIYIVVSGGRPQPPLNHFFIFHYFFFL